MDYYKESLRLHYEWKGKLETKARAKASNREELSLAYTPGVAAACLEIQKDIDKSYQLTRRWNTVAIITDGTAVLGLGDIGPEAGMPVMEGKCLLFKEFADIDAIPLCVRSKDTDEIVNAVSLLAGSFGGINLEDIAAPRCFEIERRLKERCDIPVFHDDQHGTAVVVLAAVMNALKCVGKKLGDCTVAISGAGSAGSAIAKLLHAGGASDIIMSDRQGIICKGQELSTAFEELADFTNSGRRTGTLADAMKGADVFIGVSAGGIVSPGWSPSMAKDAVMAMANPTPEIMPGKLSGRAPPWSALGRSDYPSQINNVLGVPGIFRGALDGEASDINETEARPRKEGDSGLVSESRLESTEYIIPRRLTRGGQGGHRCGQPGRESKVARI